MNFSWVHENSHHIKLWDILQNRKKHRLSQSEFINISYALHSNKNVKYVLTEFNFWRVINVQLNKCFFFTPCETIKICQIVRNWLFNESLNNHFTINILMKFIFNTLVFRYARKQSFFVLWKSSHFSHELHWEHMWRIDCNLFLLLINFLLFWFKISSRELNVFQVNEIALSGGFIIYTGKRVSCMI